MKDFFELRESLRESKIEVGDRVRVKDDAKKVVDRKLLGKSGVVVPNPMGGRSIRVKFVDGRSAMFNKNDLEVNESVALGESALAKQWQSGKSSIKSGSVELVRGKSGVHTIKKGGKTIGDFSLDYDDWVVNIKGKKGQHTLGSIDDIVKMASSMKESVELDEATDFRKGDTVHQVGSKLKGTVLHKGNRDEIIVKFGTISKSIPSSQLRLTEARKDAGADLYFNTYSAAIEKAINDTMKKHKLEVDADDYYQKVNMGPGKPGRGKTTRHTLDLVDTRTGKPSRKKLQIQVYNRETDKNPYELNFYVS